MLGAARAWLFPAATVSADNSIAWTVGLAVAGTLFVIPTAALMTTLPPVSLPSLVIRAKVLPLRVVVFVAVAGDRPRRAERRRSRCARILE